MDEVNTTDADAPANKYAERLGNRGLKRVEASALGLTAEEADLLAPPLLADYAPWVVPLTVRPNGEDATDTADDYPLLSASHRARDHDQTS
jgi:hypothetical protein